MNFLVKNFLRGLVIVVPGAATVYILYASFVWIDRLLAFPTPGVGFLVMIASIIAIGFLASNFAVRSLFGLMESVFVRAPLVKIVYSAIKDLVEAFVGDRKRFNRPVEVTFPSLDRMRILGFITREDLEFLDMRESVAVYFPQSYNVAGNLIIVARQQVRPLDVESSKLMAFIVSGGISGL